jgi:hypothetical protein
MSDRIQSFEEFWPFYVTEHSNPLNRALHFVGTTAAVTCAAAGALTLNPLLLAAAPFMGYGPAWIGHFFIEKNRPASFKYPLWSFRADFVMWSKILRRQMGVELERAKEIMAARQAAAQRPVGLHAVA